MAVERDEQSLLDEEERVIVRALADGEDLATVAARLSVPQDAARRLVVDALEKLHQGLFDGSTALAGPGPTQIRLFGRFAVVRLGCDVTPPSGQPAAVVQLLALHGGRLHCEELIEHLWPGSDPATGRTRLRNVLARLRRSSGDLVVRDQEALALAPSVTVDLNAFEESARAALAMSGDDPAGGAGAAEHALVLSRGDLLPDARYESWANGPREDTRRRRLELLDLLAGFEAGRGRLEAALAHTEVAIGLEPLEEHRYLTAAGWLTAAGRVAEARRLLTRGRAAWAELGLEPSARFRASEQLGFMPSR